MEAALLKAIVVSEVKHIVGTLLKDELVNLEKNMSAEEVSIYNKVLLICKSELTDPTITDPVVIHQKSHTVIAATLIALARSVEGIELNDTQPSGLINALKNAYMSIRSMFSK